MQPANRSIWILLALLAIEAAASFGWERYIGTTGGFIGMAGFGASAPAKILYKSFNITPEAAVEAALARLNKKAP